jgi:transposase
MDAIVESCAGLDVHQETVVVCVLRASLDQRPRPRVRTFGTTTVELLELADWLEDNRVSVVAMESTGIYWRPVWNVLEGGELDLILANARLVKNVPGRKTDQRDAEWLAQLVRCGLVERSFVPSIEQRDLRDLTRRRRKMLQVVAAEKNRVHKTLQDANVKLTTEVSDLFGVSGRALLSALCSGIALTAEDVGGMVKGNLRKKVPALIAALNGRIRPHHLRMIRFSMDHIEFLERQVRVLEKEIEVAVEPFRQARELIRTIPGIDGEAATEIVAEIGTDMGVFRSGSHLASWAGLAPGNFESAGKSRSGRTTQGNRHLKAALVQAAWAASRTKDTRLSGRFWRLARRLGRDGRKKAAVATAHSILRIAHYLLSTGNAYEEYGPDYGGAAAEARERRLLRQVERLGYQVVKAA